MGTQLYILASDMEAAGWKSRDVVVSQGYWDTTLVVVREWWHAEYGVLSAYAVSGGDFFADCNEWGGNRPMFEDVGLFEMPHTLG